MKKILAVGLFSVLSTIGVASADDYVTVSKQHPEVNRDGNVTVQGVIWHRCPHCKDLEPYIDNWIKNNKPDYVKYEIVPVGWEERVLSDGKYYNYAKTLVSSKKITDEQLSEINKSLFGLVFNQRKDLNDDNVYPIFSSYGISRSDFDSGLKSFATVTNIKLSERYTKDYNIEGTPSFVVGGKYAVNFNTIKEQSPKGLFDAINATAKKVKDEIDTSKENDIKNQHTETDSVSK